MTMQAGQAFGNYRLVKLIGEGGFGEVYLAENPLIHRLAAVKVLLPELSRDSEVVRRFLNEARAASAIRHPNIVEVLDAGATTDGAPYILMEYLEGESLHKRLGERGQLSLPEVMSIAEQAGSALSAAHAAGIVHRDLKPENLFMVGSQESGEDMVKILDFGIAKIITGEGSRDTMKTRSGLIMGSPAYMSPEQCKDSGQVDHRTDIYSLATILYQALVGRTPFVDDSPTQLMIMHLTLDPMPLGHYGVNVPSYVEDAIMCALARSPDDRYSTMEGFMCALRGEPVAVQPARSPVVAVRDRPSAGSGSRSARTAILKPDSSQAHKAKTPTRRPRPITLRPAHTTFSQSVGEKETDAGESSVSIPRARLRQMAVVGAGVVVLGGVALVVGLTRGNHSSASRENTERSVPAVQPVSPPPEPEPKPAELAAPIPTPPPPPQAAPPEQTSPAQAKPLPVPDTKAKPSHAPALDSESGSSKQAASARRHREKASVTSGPKSEAITREKF